MEFGKRTMLLLYDTSVSLTEGVSQCVTILNIYLSHLTMMRRKVFYSRFIEMKKRMLHNVVPYQKAEVDIQINFSRWARVLRLIAAFVRPYFGKEEVKGTFFLALLLILSLLPHHTFVIAQKELSCSLPPLFKGNENDSSLFEKRRLIHDYAGE